MSEFIEALTYCGDLAGLPAALLSSVPEMVEQLYDEDGNLTGEVVLVADRIRTRSNGNYSVNLLRVDPSALDDYEDEDGAIHQGWITRSPFQVLSTGLTGTDDCPFENMTPEALALFSNACPDTGGNWPMIGGFCK